MSKIAILYYHRINKLTADYNQTNVKPSHFEEHMEVLWENYDVVSLESIYSGDAFKTNRNAVAITFDDGYKDVISNAAPILNRFGFPFTCLITTENIGKDKENWTDIISRLSFEPEMFRKSVEVKLNGRIEEIKLDGLEDRVRFYRALQQIKKNTTKEEWDEIITKYCEWFGTPNKARDAFKILNRDEICELRDMGATIGAHTVTHSFFSCLSDEEIEKEISDSKEILEKILGREVYIFSYPFGDAPKRVRPLLDSVGYRIAMTSNNSLVTENSDVMYLPRVSTRDYSKDEFKTYLRNMFE